VIQMVVHAHNPRCVSGIDRVWSLISNHGTCRARQINKKGIDYVNGEVLEIDPAERNVKTSAGDFAYDCLIMALSAELTQEAILGFSEDAHHAYTLEAAKVQRSFMELFRPLSALRSPSATGQYWILAGQPFSLSGPISTCRF